MKGKTTSVKTKQIGVMGSARDPKDFEDIALGWVNTCEKKITREQLFHTVLSHP